jgi:2-phosphosulfolactate phosphatase
MAVHLAAIAIVVDALRASVTIPALLEHGAARVLVVAQVADARALAETIPDAILVGERQEQQLPGFDLGNSPLDVLDAARMDGRTVIFTSSNGAQRLTACRGADRLLVGTVSNAASVSACVRSYAEETQRDIVLISAGKYPDETNISDEDDAACAYLAARIGLPLATESRMDFTRWREAIEREGLESIFCGARHAQRLDTLGCHRDVLYCARPDTLSALPNYVAPVILSGNEVGVDLRCAQELPR